MQPCEFAKNLLTTTTIVGVFGLLLVHAAHIWHHVQLFYITAAFFLQLTIIVYWLARRASTSGDHTSFIRIVMYNMLFKLAAAVAIVIIYTRVTDIDTSLFILPFFIAYLGYTIFETYYLHQMSKPNR